MNHDWHRFERLRDDLFAYIDRCIAEDPHHKSQEGAFDISLPNRFTDECRIELYCYLLGPQRNYVWQSNQGFNHCLSKAERDIRTWMRR